MTKPKEKTCEELQAEIEDGKKKIRQLENREKMLRQIRKKCLSPAKKYKLYKSSINKSIHFVQRSLSSSTRV